MFFVNFNSLTYMAMGGYEKRDFSGIQIKGSGFEKMQNL
jgi:hypothetical protein